MCSSFAIYRDDPCQLHSEANSLAPPARLLLPYQVLREGLAMILVILLADKNLLCPCRGDAADCAAVLARNGEVDLTLPHEEGPFKRTAVVVRSHVCLNEVS